MKRVLMGIVCAISFVGCAIAMNWQSLREINCSDGRKRYERRAQGVAVEYAERVTTPNSVQYTGEKDARKIEGEEARELYAKLWEENISIRLRFLDCFALHKK